MESETPEKYRNRVQFIMQIFARFEAASGKRIDQDESTRKKSLINELSLRLYSEAEATAAQEWILRGDPVRYGSLTLADFYPSPQQLLLVSYDLGAELARAERAGVDKGYQMGYSEAQNTIQPRQKQGQPILTPLSDSERMEFEVLKGKVPDLEELNQRLTEKLRKIESNKRRKPMEAFNHG